MVRRNQAVIMGQVGHLRGDKTVQHSTIMRAARPPQLSVLTVASLLLLLSGCAPTVNLLNPLTPKFEGSYARSAGAPAGGGGGRGGGLYNKLGGGGESAPEGVRGGGG